MLRRVLDAVWASSQGAIDLADVERELGAVVPDVDVDRAAHAGVANVVGMVVLCAARARATGKVDDAVRAADHVEEFLEHRFGASDLAAYHRELEKLRGLSPAELIPKVQALNRRGTRNPARKKAGSGNGRRGSGCSSCWRRAGRMRTPCGRWRCGIGFRWNKSVGRKPGFCQRMPKNVGLVVAR